MNQVTIKFSISRGLISCVMFWLLKHKYTHAAISLDDNPDEFYSFAYTGFSTERKRSRMPKSWRENYAYYYIDVTEMEYRLLTEQINHFKENKDQYKYSTIEPLLAFLGIPYRQKDSYYCSYFVADMLSLSGAYLLKRSSSLYLPNLLAKEMRACRHEEYSYRCVQQ